MKETKKQIVARYAPLVRAAEKAWNVEEVGRLLAERNALLEAK
jgi:hypothetical protein